MTSVNPALGAYYYGRRYQVALVPPGSIDGIIYGTEGKRPSSVRIAFEIDRDLTSKANKCFVALYNLTTANRQTIKPNTLVELLAGYSGNVASIYIGYCVKVVTERQGADIVTKLECGDGEPYITYATFDRSYSGAVTLAQVLQDVATAMRVSLNGQVQSATPGIVKGLPNKTYGRGMHVHGSCRATLDKLLHPLKIDWSVQSGKLTILPRDAANVVRAQVLSTETGLVGVPSDNGDYVSFQSLLNPDIAPGGLVVLQSKNQQLSRAYKLRKVKFIGDTHGGDWVADCEGVALTNSYRVLSVAKGFAYASAVLP